MSREDKTVTNANEDTVQKKTSDMSAEEGLIQSLTNLRDNINAGHKLEERYTMRTVDLEIEVDEYGPEDVKSTREKLNASQAVFAKLLGVSTKAVQSWEQGLAPSPMARRLLSLINNDPEYWRNILRGSVRKIGDADENRNALTDG